MLDGVIVYIDGQGRPIFKDLLFRKSTCIFVAFDLLYLNGKDLRTLPLIERKRQLRKLLQRRRSRILYLDHVENDGRLLFEQIVKITVEPPSPAVRTPVCLWMVVKGVCKVGIVGWSGGHPRIIQLHLSMKVSFRLADYPPT